MPYEIEFIGVGSEVKKDADAICFRWLDHRDYWNAVYKIGVFDGGFEAHGKKMVEHMNQYYFNSSDYYDKVIDCVFVSHSDQDHVIGIKTILENFKVKNLYMNRPWLYLDDLYDKVNDGRITKESLRKELRETYEAIADIEDMALERGVYIHEAFQGEKICDKLLIASPSKQFYLDLIVESAKTPLENNKTPLSMLYKGIKNYGYSLSETWNDELLREDAETSAENETSIILRGSIDTNDGFLLVGDAGIRALNKAMDYLDSIGEDVRYSISNYQIPHHGSRHNINPSTLNRMIGAKVAEGVTIEKYAVASVAKYSDHPRKMVTNAYIRRGVKTFKTDGEVIRHVHGNMPDRKWTSIEAIEFSRQVEKYDEDS